MKLSLSSKAEICWRKTCNGSRRYIDVLPVDPSVQDASTNFSSKPLLENIFPQLSDTIFLQSEIDLILSRNMSRSKSLLWKNRNNWLAIRRPVFLARTSKKDANSSSNVSAAEMVGEGCGVSLSGMSNWPGSWQSSAEYWGVTGVEAGRTVDSTERRISVFGKRCFADVANLHFARWRVKQNAESVVYGQNGHFNDGDMVGDSLRWNRWPSLNVGQWVLLIPA